MRKSEQALSVYSPLTGWCESLEDSPDAVFSEKLLGDGVSIDPTEGIVTAPFDAEVINVPQSCHAINLRALNGAEFLIHIGIDTVDLGGKGFKAHVRSGDSVKLGQKLLSFDLDQTLRGAKSLRSPFLLLHNEQYAIEPKLLSGGVKAGDKLFEVVPVDEATIENLASPVSDSVDVIQKTVIVGLAHGIHARPAAHLSASIKHLHAKVECATADDSLANGRSPVAMMALGVKCGDALKVTASGTDARIALQQFVTVLNPLEAQNTEATGRQVDAKPPALNERQLAAPRPGEIIPAQCAATGLAVGVALRLQEWIAPPNQAVRGPDTELNALKVALEIVHKYLADISVHHDGTGHEIAEAHIALLEDPTLLAAAASNIELGEGAASAWQNSLESAMSALRLLDDPRMRERVDDLADLNRRVQRTLSGQTPGEMISLPENSILLAEEILPSQLLELEHKCLNGICTVAGGTTSHVAILADSMGVPMLSAAGNRILNISDGTTLFLDAVHGKLHVDPGADQIEAHRKDIQTDQRLNEEARKTANLDCMMADGVRVKVLANIASVQDAESAVLCGADGCGLLRTEFVFMERHTAPQVVEQLRIYQEIADAFGSRPLVVRTLDAGGDKPIAFIQHSSEENPALGVRGIRLSLRHTDIFRSQLEALLRVQQSGPLRLMVPMVISLDEVLAVREMTDLLCTELQIDTKVQLGVMIETPAAAMIAEELIQAVDFMSIGTNDLTQYTLAIDRGEPSLATSLDTLHPAVLRLIGQTAAAAINAGKPVAVCGAAAADHYAAPILLGLGIREFSMVQSAIARQKARIRGWTSGECTELAQQALALGTAHDVRILAQQFVSSRERSC